MYEMQNFIILSENQNMSTQNIDAVIDDFLLHIQSAQISQINLGLKGLITHAQVWYAAQVARKWNMPVL